MQLSFCSLTRFQLTDPSIPVMEKAAQDPERKVTFVDLVPGRLYNITMWTVSGGVTSRYPTSYNLNRHPNQHDQKAWEKSRPTSVKSYPKIHCHHQNDTVWKIPQKCGRSGLKSLPQALIKSPKHQKIAQSGHTDPSHTFWCLQM